ncbi:hypothetical protein ABPG72_001442 [Tetrahymena utriculariae]
MATKKQCFYEVLELNKDCTNEEIKTAYKKFALKYHPDKNRDKPEEAKLKFQEISEAYTVLSDPDKRATYDKYGTIDEDEIGFDYDSFMQEFDVNDFGHFMSAMMGDMFFTDFNNFTHRDRGQKKKYGKRRQNNQDPLSNFFTIKFSNGAPTKQQKKPEDEEWETDSEDESKKKKNQEDDEWTDEEDDDDDEEFSDEEDEDQQDDKKDEQKEGEQKEKKEGEGQQKKPKKKVGPSPDEIKMSDFVQFGMMDPFSMMMGLEFGGQSNSEMMAMYEFTAQNIKMLKGDKIQCKLCEQEMVEEDLDDHFENDHDEEFQEFKKDYMKKFGKKGKKNK